MLRRGRHRLAGALLVWSASLRVFPGVFLAALALAAGLRMWDERRFVLGSDHRRFAAGALIALAVLWPTNDMGLPTVVAYAHDTRTRVLKDESLADPYGTWKEVRRETFARRQTLWWLGVGLFVALLARAARRREE